MADQDHDGPNIKSLIIDIIHHFWPSLREFPGFLKQFITPIVKATKRNSTKTFFTLPEYMTWKESTGNDGKGWTVKYYKGLGTSTSAEAKDYFSNLDCHEINFKNISNDHCIVENDESSSDDGMDIDIIKAPEESVSGSSLIEMAFSKKKVEQRKTWLNNLKKDTFLNYSEAQEEGVNYSDFINRELILFSQADNQRSIPHVYDGFKPSQRKVLFSCFLKNVKSEIKVAQLSGYIGEKSAYHHDEASLAGTIINMAQDFVGSNNINLLTPAGQFGTRRMGGKDAASPRYIFTKLEKIARKIFHPDDDELLTYLNDDGQPIEPEYYMPVIPLILVNGSDGIGTGWSTSVPNHDPRLIIQNLRNLIKGEELIKMSPHYYGFTGKIEADSCKDRHYHIYGRIERKDDTTLFISELPLKKWTQDYKVFLESMITGEKKDPEIKDFQENHTDSTVSFTISATKEKIDEFEKEKVEGLMGKFKLCSTISTSNMHLFNQDGRIQKFDSPEAIMMNFYSKRLEFYVLRKANLLKILRREQKMLSNRARFIEAVCTGDLIVSNRKRTDILSDLKDAGYDLFPKEKDKTKADERNEEDESDSLNDTDSIAVLARGYEYLLGMKIWSLTFEKAEQLRKELLEKTQIVAVLEATTPEQIWETDLVDIEEALNERDGAFSNAVENEKNAQNKNKKQKAKKNLKKGSKKMIDEDFNPVKKAAPKKKAAQISKAKPKTKEKAKPKTIEIKSKTKEKVKPIATETKSVDKSFDNALVSASESDDEMPSLAARLQEKMKITPANDKEDIFSSSSFEKKQDISSPSDNCELLDESVEHIPVKVTKLPNIKKKPVKKTTNTKKAPRKKKVVIVESSDDETLDEEDSVLSESFDEDNTPTVAVLPRSRSTRGRKAVVSYAIDSDSDSDF